MYFHLLIFLAHFSLQIKSIHFVVWRNHIHFHVFIFSQLYLLFRPAKNNLFSSNIHACACGCFSLPFPTESFKGLYSKTSRSLTYFLLRWVMFSPHMITGWGKGPWDFHTNKYFVNTSTILLAPKSTKNTIRLFISWRIVPQFRSLIVWNKFSKIQEFLEVKA